jgi:uncharacterized membrane protein
MAREVINEDGDRVVVDEPSYVSYYSPVARFIWTILGIVNALLAIRFVLKLLGANPAAGFTDFIYTLTSPLVSPFAGVIRTTSAGTNTFEWFTILAMVVYWLLAWAIVRLATVNRPMARY